MNISLKYLLNLTIIILMVFTIFYNTRRYNLKEQKLITFISLIIIKYNTQKNYSKLKYKTF